MDFTSKKEGKQEICPASRLSTKGCILLCAAIIQRAHDDYMFSTIREREMIRQFLDSPLFQLYSWGVEVNAEDIVKIWESDREALINGYSL